MKRVLSVAVAMTTVFQLHAAKVVSVSARNARNGDADVSDVISRCEVMPSFPTDHRCWLQMWLLHLHACWPCRTVNRLTSRI